MIRIAALAVVLAGCNAVFGLDEPSGADAGIGPTAAGSVTAFSLDYLTLEAPSQRFILRAEFGPASSTCAEQDRVGGCVLAACVNAPAPRPDAGLVTFAGELIGTLTPAGDGNYPTTTTTGRLFAAGGPLRISAAGGEVPAFDTSLATPVPVTFSTTMPSPAGNPVAIDRGLALTLDWSGGTDGVVAIEVNSGSTEKKVACLFPVSAGTGTIDATLLAQLPAGPGQLTSGVSTVEQVISGTYSIQLLRGVVGLRDDGDWAAGPIDLQ